MIGVFIRADATQIVLGKKHKKGILVQECTVLPSVLAALKGGDVDRLGQLFLDIAELFKLKDDEFYVALPDDLFMIDCSVYEYDLRNEDVPISHMSQFLHADLEKFSVLPFMEFQKKNNRMVTGCALEKRLIQTIIDAASKTETLLWHIEPASLSFLRFVDTWMNEQYILEVFGNASSFVAYSPVAGMFKMPLPELAWSRLEAADDETINSLLVQMIARNDAMAERTFGIANADVPIHVLSPYAKRLMKLPALKNRLATLQPADFVHVDPKKGALGLDSIVSVGVLCEAVSGSANKNAK